MKEADQLSVIQWGTRRDQLVGGPSYLQHLTGKYRELWWTNPHYCALVLIPHIIDLWLNDQSIGQQET